jgi:hypothetical protein
MMAKHGVQAGSLADATFKVTLIDAEYTGKVERDVLITCGQIATDAGCLEIISSRDGRLAATYAPGTWKSAEIVREEGPARV